MSGSAGRRPGLFSRRDHAVIAAASISMLLVQMDWFALNLMLPVIGRDFGTPTTNLQWLVSGYRDKSRCSGLWVGGEAILRSALTGRLERTVL
ncbi:hypothetical protein ACWGKW_38400, partial [Streptomyces sp. NPDC054766]